MASRCGIRNNAPRQHNGEDVMAKKKQKTPKRKHKQTAAEKRARRERKKKYMMIFINGKQKRVPRPQLIEGLPADEFIARNADPIWLQQNELWELMTPEDQAEGLPVAGHEDDDWL
jgi:hypothetical protein